MTACTDDWWLDTDEKLAAALEGATIERIETREVMDDRYIILHLKGRPAIEFQGASTIGSQHVYAMVADNDGR